MYLSDLNLQFLISNIQTVCNKTILIASPSWQALSCTHTDVTSYTQDVLTYCIATNDPDKAAQHFGITITPFYVEETLVCYFLIFDKNSVQLSAYLKTLTSLLIAPQISDRHSQMANTRSILVNQLSNIHQGISEIEPIMKDFDYRYNCPRCAILLEIAHQNKHAFSYKFDSSETAIESLITSHSLYSKDDIFGFLSSERYVIYKDTQNLCESDRPDMLSGYADSIVKDIKKQQGILLHAGIGSTYEDLPNLRNSYLEALFLITNYDYLNADAALSLQIKNYIFEFLASRISPGYWNSRFHVLSQQLSTQPLLLETAIELSRHDQNLSRTAESLGLHRNTMLQRAAKLKNVTGLNPAQNDFDRMTLRAFALHVNQKITLQAGIVIQPNSVLHQGMQKMADLVSKNSGGAININIHTLSISGNNDHLFEILRSGSIDFIVAATGVMNRFTNNRSKVLDYPFLFHSNSEAKYLLNSLILQEIEPYLDTIGVKCLNIWSMGWRYLTSKEPIHTPQDLAGRKVRVMFTEALDEYYRSMGAIPIKMNYNDVKDALHAGIIECQENPYSNTLGMKFYEEQTYITRLKYYLSTEALYVSKNTWSKLSTEQQNVIQSAALETTNWIFQEQQEVINQNCKRILTQEKGMKIIEVTPEEAKQWKEFAKNMYDTFPHQDLLSKIAQLRKEYYAGK